MEKNNGSNPSKYPNVAKLTAIINSSHDPQKLLKLLQGHLPERK